MKGLLTLALAAAALPVLAQPRTADLVEWRVRADRTAPGADARVVFDATVAPGWRLYALASPVGIPLTVSFDSLPLGVQTGRRVQAGVREGYDAVFESAYPYFAETGRVVQRLRVGEGVAAGTHEVSGTVRYAVCDDEICLAPAQTAFRVPLVVE
jgi:DsbC/DsbD-like thiol-disulfide interchange protein